LPQLRTLLIADTRTGTVGVQRANRRCRNGETRHGKERDRDGGASKAM
jgi:hypothetical protein